MVGRIRKLILLFLIASSNFLCAQEKFDYSREFKFRNGIYLSIEDFKNNQPSLPLPAVVNQDRVYLESALCMNKIEYVEEGIVYELKSKDVWGICINGEPYIKHVETNDIRKVLSKQCFYKLFSIGTISTYFIQKVHSNDGLWGSNYMDYGNPIMNGNARRGSSKIKILEYALDLETGISYNKKTQAKEIIELIKKDIFFKDQKIKKKSVSIFITNFNKRHPFQIPIE